MPRIPGELVAKRTSQKKKGSDPKNTNLQFTPPIATNMEVNLRIVTLVNVEDFFGTTVKGGPSAREHGTAHILLQVANFYVSYPFQSLVVKKWRHSQLYLEKIKISTLINKCPGFPGNSWQKELAKKKRAQIQRTQICSLPPPIATNMEVNLRIVTLVNVEVFFLRYGKRRTERSPTWHCPRPTSSSKFLCKFPIVGC